MATERIIYNRRTMMQRENKNQTQNKASNVIEDLTVGEIETTNIKGGPFDYLLEIDGIKGESSPRR
jgi:hypothetical protein